MFSNNSSNLTIHSLISIWAERTPEAVAITAPGRSPLTYNKLFSQIEKVIRKLNAMGIGRNDRVAVVLPNGPEMAVTFLAVSSGATCAPLNPSYKANEFDFFLSDLNAKALIIQSDVKSSAVSIAEKMGINVIRLSPLMTEEAGVFTLIGGESTSSTNGGFAEVEDVALVLHTSGTTSRPKIVPLTHSNLCTSAHNIRETLDLIGSDRCLNVMPLFHIHGLIGATLSSMSAGASIVCIPGFFAPKFFEWMKSFNPTWYTAVPTMHQAILTRAEDNYEIIKNNKLRFIRSSSSALPPQVMNGLEKTFNVPVIESYGMTEASHQMSSNPLPPHPRKAGSVGVAAGPEVAIMDEEGNLLPLGEIGEIVIRGANVTKGYENNPEANKRAFVNGWFRTGDQGYFDADNYLVIKDRIKEIINRGGEKISPREIDEVLLDHPEITQAVTFAVPHVRLGEDVAAAVVLRDGALVTEWEIQKFLASRLADFKIPRRVVILDEIPKGPTGKMQRIGLAEKLGLTQSDQQESKVKIEYKPPSTPIEEKLAQIWSQVLEVEKISVKDNYFNLGGDSILAGQIISKICEELQIQRLPLVIFIHAPTIERMANLLEQKQLVFPPASLVAIQPEGSRPPIYCVHACEGEVLFLQNLAHHLSQDQPFYALRAQGLDGISAPFELVEEMAAHYLKEIEAFQPEGPYRIGGAGVGGIVALEMAQQLISKNKSVDALILLDTLPPDPVESGPKPPGSKKSLDYYLRRLIFYMKMGPRELTKIGVAILRNLYISIAARFVPHHKTFSLIQRAVWRYVPKVYEGETILFVPEKRQGYPHNPKLRVNGWYDYVKGELDVHIIPGEHLAILDEPNVQILAQQLGAYLDKVT